MEEKKVKPQLHQSHLAMLYRCGEKFRRVFLEKEKEPPTTPLVIGTATHAVIARDLGNKIERGVLLPREAIRDHTRDEFAKAWETMPVVLNQEEIDDGLQKTRDTCQDITIELALLHHYDIAPKITPKHVERTWVIEATGYPYDLAGTIDVDEIVEFDREKGLFLTRPIFKIRDTKTKAKNIGQREVDTSEQYTFYHFAKYMLDGILADYVIQDNLIKPTKTRPAVALSYQSTRTIDDHVVVQRRFETACDVIQKGAFTPANPSDWWCSKEFCGFAATGRCKYFNSKRSTIITKGESNGPRKGEPANPSALIESLKGCLSED